MLECRFADEEPLLGGCQHLVNVLDERDSELLRCSRMSDQSMWTVQRIRPIVLEWDAALRSAIPAYARLAPAAEDRGSVLRPPASPEAIAAAEEALGLEFPPAYRSFLEIANGAYAGPYHANYVARLTEPDDDELLSVEDVVAFADNTPVPSLVEMWRENMDEFVDRQEEPSFDSSVQVFDFAPGSRAVLITRPVQDGIVALVPFPGEWQVWEFFWGEVRAHESFASFLQEHAREVRAGARTRAQQLKAAKASGLSPLNLDQLAEQGDPEAVPLASRALVDPGESVPEKERVAWTLVLLGDRAAIPALREALDRLDDPGSSAPSSLKPEDEAVSRARLEHYLLMALDSCGDPAVVDELNRRAAGAPEGWAARYLDRRTKLPRW
jgi:hypothetical protein